MPLQYIIYPHRPLASEKFFTMFVHMHLLENCWHLDISQHYNTNDNNWRPSIGGGALSYLLFFPSL